jgi:OTU domain-containing protein 3
MPCKKGKQTTKTTVAATKKSEKQDDRIRKREFKKQQAIEKDYQSKEELAFSSFLAEIGLIVKYMDGDGNCLFRSLADQLTGKQDNHLVFRFKVMSYIEQQRDHFILFMEDDEDFDDYVSRMKTTREWGGHQELYAASQTFRVNIVVHQADYLQAPRFVLQCEEATRDIHLSYHGDCHYNSVRSVQDVDGDDGSCRPAMEISLASLNQSSPSSSCSGTTAAATSTSSSSSSLWTKQEQAVMRGLPWITDIAEAQVSRQLFL